MNNQLKRLSASVLAAFLCTSAALSPAAPMKASAYELLGESGFENKILPWHTVEISPARQEAELDDGAAHIRLLYTGGTERKGYELQFRHRGLNFRRGHKYRIRFKAKASRDGLALTSYIGDPITFDRYFVLDGETTDMHMGPHMGGRWGTPALLTTEYQEFSGIFTPTEDISGAEWTFYYAYDDFFPEHTVKEGDELWFDDMSAEDLTDQETVPPERTYGYTGRGFCGAENQYISVNQLGYFPDSAKIAVLADNQGDTSYRAESIELNGKYDFEVVSAADGAVVYTGETDKAKTDRDSGDTVCRIDFTELTETGEYYLRIKDQEWRSAPFRIGTDIYSASGHNLLTDALNVFYQNRAGTDIRAEYITSGDPAALAHAEDRDEAVGIVLKQWPAWPITTLNEAEAAGSSHINTSGGWYTGFDYDKDMTESGSALWTLMNLYERSSHTLAGAAKFTDGSGTVAVPETDNQIPDLLDECRYELDYMAKMKVQPDEETWGEFAGLYYHRIQGLGFSPKKPDYDHEYHAGFAVYPPTFAATLNFAACAALGARLWAPYDAEYAAELMTAAKEAYAAYFWHYYAADCSRTAGTLVMECMKEDINPQSLYAPIIQYGSAVSYGDKEVLDEDYWAACELYITAAVTGDPDADTYFDHLSRYPQAFKVSSRSVENENIISYGNEGSFTMRTCTSTASSGSLSLLLHRVLLNDQQWSRLINSVIMTADEYFYSEEYQGYGTPYKYDGPGYSEPFGIDIPIYKMGYENASNARVLSNLTALAYAYDLTGKDKYLNGVVSGMDYLLGVNPLAFSFITGYGSYHVQNPAHRFWQKENDDSLPSAPDGVVVSGPNAWLQDKYVRLLGLRVQDDPPSQRCYADSVESWSTNAASLSANASLAWIVSFLQDEAEKNDVIGDVSGDRRFSIADAVLLQKWLLAEPRTRLANWKAGDFSGDGILNAIDLTLMKRELMKPLHAPD